MEENSTTSTTDTSNSQQKNSSFISVVFGFIKSIFGIILNSIKQVLRFFIRLDFAGKITFIIIILLVILVSYLVGRANGRSAATDEYEEEIAELQGTIDDIRERLNE